MPYVIALDDGHGMETAGKRTPFIRSLGRSIKENEFNREIVRFLDIELKRCGFLTLQVAPLDRDTPLKTRTDLANQANADAYIAIHYNAFDGNFSAPTPSGIELYVHPGQKNRAAGRLAENIAKYLRQGTPQNFRGIKEADFHVLRETKMIAVLTENGFMDDPVEALRMIDVNFQREVAVEHAKGICDYFNVRYVPATIDDDGIHQVQIGAFSKRENAETLAKRARNRGFSTFIRYSNRLYKVQIGAFTERENAEALAKSARAKGFEAIIV
ncbi:N-acetylmuramoyl-L-alanine amidase [Thalassobacillus hwangdonensis]|uniref:N-acetylmuramoyl-L-alanine amidase n=1 Tax=Thalassobacillus hwangdonensis TaxID=546108 RepID=A0ABW3L693_9BACI